MIILGNSCSSAYCYNILNCPIANPFAYGSVEIQFLIKLATDIKAVDLHDVQFCSVPDGWLKRSYVKCVIQNQFNVVFFHYYNKTMDEVKDIYFRRLARLETLLNEKNEVIFLLAISNRFKALKYFYAKKLPQIRKIAVKTAFLPNDQQWQMIKKLNNIYLATTDSKIDDVVASNFNIPNRTLRVSCKQDDDAWTAISKAFVEKMQL